MPCFHFAFCALALTCFFPLPLQGQPTAKVTVLNRISRQAAYIFSGTVLSVERLHPKDPNEVSTVQITFRVDQAIKGVTAKQTFSIREWAGLWDGDDRYRRGQHVLLFLYRSSKLGLTSPVGGDAGRYELDGAGRILGNPHALEELQPPTRSRMKRKPVKVQNLMHAIQRPRGK